MLQTRAGYAAAIEAVADLGARSLPFTELEMAVLCVIAYH